MEPSTLSNLSLTHRLYWGLAINAVIIVVEFTGGYLINSIGLMSDAGHNLIDQGQILLLGSGFTGIVAWRTRKRR